jgi:hypothetical protein
MSGMQMGKQVKDAEQLTTKVLIDLMILPVAS